MFSIKLLVVLLWLSSAFANPLERLRNKRAIDLNGYHDIKKMVHDAESKYSVKTLTPSITYTSETKSGVEILHSLTATLTRENMPRPGLKRPSHPTGFAKRMTDLNKLEKDEVGHVLALSMGGPNVLMNLVPQHSITNRNLKKTEDNYSYWNQTEGLIREYLKDPDVEKIVWEAIMMYDGPRNVKKNRRPAGFGVIYTVYYKNGRAPHDNGDLVFENDFN